MTQPRREKHGTFDGRFPLCPQVLLLRKYFENTEPPVLNLDKISLYRRDRLLRGGTANQPPMRRQSVFRLVPDVSEKGLIYMRQTIFTSGTLLLFVAAALSQSGSSFRQNTLSCDDQSAPNPGGSSVGTNILCTPDSDLNIFDGTDSTTPDYIGKHPGTAFMEMQFYPPGWFVSCDTTDRWCSALNIDSLSENQNT